LELFRNIEKNPLKFIEAIPLSENLKDLITRMLKIDEKERISWPEIFKHPVITTPVVKASGGAKIKLIA